jgi:hypothetical protein
MLVGSYWDNHRAGIATRIDHTAGGSLVRALTITKNQVQSHELTEQVQENKLLSCLADTPANRDGEYKRLKKLIAGGAYVGHGITQAEKDCLEKIKAGPVSVKSVLKKTFSFTPTLCGSVIYEPRKHVGGTTISVPQSCQQPVTLQVEGSYSQKFNDGSSTIDPKIGTDVVVPRDSNELTLMPIKNRKKYGMLLVNGRPIDSKRSYNISKLNIDLNVAQIPSSYVDLEGILRIDFYN